MAAEENQTGTGLAAWRLTDLERRMHAIETWRGIKDVEIALLNQTISRQAQIWGAVASFVTSLLIMLVQWWLKH